MLTKSVREEIERLLLQWYRDALQCEGGISSHPMWNQAARGPRAGNQMPIFHGQAELTDRALRAMEEYLRTLLLEHHLNVEIPPPAAGRIRLIRNSLHRTEEAKARARSMSRTTYWRWVGRANDAFWERFSDQNR